MKASVQLHRINRLRSRMCGAELFTITTDRKFPRHAHDQFGIGLIHAGAHRSWSGRGFVEACRGDIVTVNPGEMHDGSPYGSNARGWRMIYFEPSLVDEVFVRENPSTFEFTAPVVRDGIIAHKFRELFDALSNGIESLEREQAVVGLLASISQCYASTQPRQESNADVRAALRRMNDAPATATTLAELAALSGVSRFSFLRSFAAATGVTPHAYLIQLRVQRARRLLTRPGSIADIAILTGFADQSHMTRAFARQLGITPARYRAGNI